MKKGTIGSGKLGYRGTPTSVEAVLKPGAGTLNRGPYYSFTVLCGARLQRSQRQPNKPPPVNANKMLDGSGTA